jgi:hypothetical protein
VVKKHLTPSLIVSCIAPFVAMGGTGLAATLYLITKKSQIKPSVVNALKGNPGPAGQNGAPGPRGPMGATGAKVRPGPGARPERPGPRARPGRPA